MTYTEFIEKIKEKAHEDLHYSYDMMTFYPEGYTSDDPQTLELIMNSNSVYVGGEPSPWLKTDILVLMDVKDDKIKSLQRIATKKLYEKLQNQMFEELFAQIRQEHEASVKNASAIHDRADYGKIQLILRPLNYQLHEQEFYDAVYKRFDDVALVLYQLIEAKVSNKTPLGSKTDFISSRINKRELKKWNVTEEQVLDDALKNTCRLVKRYIFITVISYAFFFFFFVGLSSVFPVFDSVEVFEVFGVLDNLGICPHSSFGIVFAAIFLGLF